MNAQNLGHVPAIKRGIPRESNNTPFTYSRVHVSDIIGHTMETIVAIHSSLFNLYEYFLKKEKKNLYE